MDLKPKILCVDDDENLLIINSSILQSAGYEVISASSGNECLSSVKDKRPDLVLLDVMLPDLNGFDVCKQIKTDAELRDTHVVLISGLETSSESQIKGLEAGADGYIVRPISGQELLARVQAMIRLKQTEMELKRNLGQLKTILESVGEGIFGVDKDGDAIFANPALLKMTGYESEELLGRNLHFVLRHSRPDGSSYEIKDCPVYSSLKKGQSFFNIENEVIWRKDGTNLPVEYTSAPIIENGQVAGAVVVIRDITERRKAEEEIKRLNQELERRVVERTKQLQAVIEELEGEIIDRKRAEDALKESEEKFRAITCTATDAIILMNDQGKISFWNPAAEKMFGYSPQEAIGKDLHLFLAPEEYHEEYRRGFSVFRTTGKGTVVGKTLELSAIRKDGTRFPMEISNSVINTKGKWEAVGIIRDITERKLDEATMKQYAERLQALSNRLIEVQEAERRYIAQELHDEIGQSLTAIKLSLENIVALQDENKGDSLKNAQALVQDLIQKVRNLSLTLHPSMLDDLGLLPSLLWLVDRYGKQTSVRVEFRHSGLDRRFKPEIETAAYRIIQEALTNVARHSNASGVTVFIIANQVKLTICIEDKGVGFDYEKVKVSGETVGLKWMKERLAIIGGELKIETSPGSGTRITAIIPLLDSI